MTNTKRIAMLLADGKARSSKEICTSLNINIDQFRTALHQMSKTGRVVRAPISYSLTNTGMEFAAIVPSMSDKVLKRRAILLAARRARAKAALLRSQESSNVIISQAKQSRSALESAWM